MGKKLWRHISFSSICFCYYRKHPNNDNKIFPLPSSSCFQQHFHDWFYVLRWNSDLWKLVWTLLLSNSTTSVIWHIDANCFPFQLLKVPVTSFSHQARTLKTNLLGLISNFSKYYFKTGTICLLFLSSHVFTALEFDTNHFGILLWEIVNPRDYDEIKIPIGKTFRKYKPIRHFLMSRK